MNELMSECKEEALEALRFKSRFDEFDPERYYKDALFNFSTGFLAHDGGMSVGITSEATRYGIRKPVAISLELYRDWIFQNSCITIQRIGVLCHAFLYAVDLDQHNTRTLEFPVPFFTQGIGYTPVQVRAELIGGKNQRIFLDLA